MATEQKAPLVLTNESVSDIVLFCDVAKANGAILSLKEILMLTSLETTEKELQQAWHFSPALNARYDLRQGQVYEKSLTQQGYLVQKEEKERKSRALSNILYANKFAALCQDSNSKVLSISGSTSYLSVSRDDDLDFFCISRKDAMWLFLTKALILARLIRLLQKPCPWLCLSYVMDEDYATREFTTPQDGLFARDALSTRVLYGKEYYEDLLRKSDWMSGFFPKLYKQRVRNLQAKNVLKRSSTGVRIVNLFLYYTAGTYIRIKSFLLNRAYLKESNRARLFRLRIGKDHCIYESLSYLSLRNLYSRLEVKKSA